MYGKLLEAFGPQGWWPVRLRGKLVYIPGDYSHPRTESQALEVCTGAVLTQNTSWKNVEKALGNLRASGIKDLDSFLRTGRSLPEMIRPAGYYNQKAAVLLELLRKAKKSGGVREFLSVTSRSELLKSRGIGPETADSMLLYGGHRPQFVVDAYTRRVFSRLGAVGEGWDYHEIKLFFESNLPGDLAVYKEFHALIVELGKRHCRKKPLCRGCPLSQGCDRFTCQEQEVDAFP